MRPERRERHINLIRCGKSEDFTTRPMVASSAKRLPNEWADFFGLHLPEDRSLGGRLVCPEASTYAVRIPIARAGVRPEPTRPFASFLGTYTSFTSIVDGGVQVDSHIRPQALTGPTPMDVDGGPSRSRALVTTAGSISQLLRTPPYRKPRAPVPDGRIDWRFPRGVSVDKGIQSIP